MAEYNENYEINSDPDGIDLEPAAEEQTQGDFVLTGGETEQHEDTRPETEEDRKRHEEWLKRAEKSTDDVMQSIANIQGKAAAAEAEENDDEIKASPAYLERLHQKNLERDKRRGDSDDEEENKRIEAAERAEIARVKAAQADKKENAVEAEADADPDGYSEEAKPKKKMPEFLSKAQAKYKNRPRSNRIVVIVSVILIICLFFVLIGAFSGSSGGGFGGKGKGEGDKKEATVVAGNEDAGIAEFSKEAERREAEKQKAEESGEDFNVSDATGEKRSGSAGSGSEGSLDDFLSGGKKNGKVGRIAPNGKLIIEDAANAGNGTVKSYGDRNYRYHRSPEYQNKQQSFFNALTSSTKVMTLFDRKKTGSEQQSGAGNGYGTRNGLYGDRNALANLSPGEIQQLMAGNGQQQEQSDRNENYYKSHKDSGEIKDEYLPRTRRRPLTKFEIKAGTVINGVLISGINSDMPGTIIGQVSENVYDTATGYYLLIPQGSRMIGNYSSHVVYGQKRVLTVWTRIIYPDGSSLNLEGLYGGDQAGYSGFKQKVNNHYGNLLSAAIFSSVFVWAGKEATKNDTDRYGRENTAAEAVMEQISSLGARLAERNLNIAPTLTIKPGYRFAIVTTKDVAFAEDYIIGAK